MPLFHDHMMDPKMANVIDDFYGQVKRGGIISRVLQKINHFALSSLFFASPFVHAANVSRHWATARGFDWIRPQQLKSLAVDSARAAKEVWTQGPKYQQALRDGSGLLYGDVANKNFYGTLLKEAGAELVKDPKRWGELVSHLPGPFRELVQRPADLIKIVNDASQRALWGASDFFMLQRTMELERKGLSSRKAIAEAEKHIPNYRLPPEVLGSREFQRVLANPLVSSFSRYHYGMVNSYVHMARDMLSPNATKEERIEALGSALATALLLAYVKPKISEAVQQMTGNKDASVGARGSEQIPQDVIDWWKGEKSVSQIVSSFLTMSPVLKTGLEIATNTDFFTHKPIAESGGLAGLGQAAEHVAEGLFMPYKEANTAYEKDKSLPGAWAEQTFGFKNPTPKQVAAKKKALKAQEKAAKWRKKHPKGMIEEGVDGL